MTVHLRYLILIVAAACISGAQAKTRYGVRCADCHDRNRQAMTVLGQDPSRTGTRQGVKTYTVRAGQTVTLPLEVIDGDRSYAVTLSDLDRGGLADSGHRLVFNADPDWVDYTGDHPPYFASTASRHTWKDTTRRFDFVLAVAPETPADTYSLQWEVAGKNGGKWAQGELIFLEVLSAGPVRGNGDMDHDGDVDGVDFAQWALQWQRRACTVDNQSCVRADMDVDGDVDANDLTVMMARWLRRKPLQLSVRASADDAEERLVDGDIDLTSSDLEMVMEDDEQLVGLRFDRVPLDQGLHIARAFLQFTVDEVDAGDCVLSIEGQAADDAPLFVDRPRDISLRPRTQAIVSWEVPAWTDVGEANRHQRSPDLSDVIEEITARPGWMRGQALVLLISGQGQRTAESFDGTPRGAPVLHIEFTLSPDVEEQPRAEASDESGRFYFSTE